MRFCQRHDIAAQLFDTREAPANLAQVQQQYPGVPIFLGELNTSQLMQSDEILLSPGVCPQSPAIATCIAQGKTVISDIELFAREAKAPIIGITGTNGKSTVTTLTGELINACGLRALIGGNLGIPALDLLAQDSPDYYVLELSSFQLEITHQLPLSVACVLNVTPDHLDRHADMASYIAAKQRIYRQADTAVYFTADKATHPQSTCPNSLQISCDGSACNTFGLRSDAGELVLAFEGQDLISSTQLSLRGIHNFHNALFALAIGHAIGLAFPPMCAALKQFTGLPHRMQWVRDLDDGVSWINDSKGTNVGATVAAINGIGADMLGKIILIAGGQAKDDDFTALYEPVRDYVRMVVLVGVDADKIERSLGNVVAVSRVNSMGRSG